MGKPAARLGDMMSNTGMITGPGAATVLINKLPAARMGDFHTTPMVIPGTPPVPMVGGPIVGPGCSNVLICKMPAAVVGDMATTVGPPGTISMGSTNVLIGMNGSGGGGGGGGSGTPQAKTIKALKAGKIKPVKGTETHPVEIQAIAHVMQKYHPRKQFKIDLKLLESMATRRTQKNQEELEKSGKLTIKHFAGYFQDIENTEGYEAARHFACVSVNYNRLNKLARRFIDGSDTNSDNDPNFMPTRFMLLYGADDNKLQQTDPHPDNVKGAQEHKLTVANLRKGLRLLGANIAETGPYDDEVLKAHTRYINSRVQKETQGIHTHVVESGETLGAIARQYGLPTWKYLYELNKNAVGDNPDLLAAGTKLAIPQQNSTSGDEKIIADGADPAFYLGGSRYRYPWVLFSTTIIDENNSLKKEKNNEKYTYELRDIQSANSLARGEIARADELTILIPDSQGMEISVNGKTCDIETGG